MLTERKLAVVLSLLKENPNPKYKLEQYSITPGIASSILFLASEDIKNKKVFDLGCGSGRFGIGAALLGAREVVFVDIDEDVLKIAKENARIVEKKTGVKILEKCRWVCMNVEKISEKSDTVIQFPPFEGMKKDLDIIFFKKALEIARNVYSIHKSSKETKDKLRKICKEFSAKIELEKSFKYKLPWKERNKIGYKVFLLVAKR